jgi:NADH-quinone oxidoreductase subunit E
MKDVTSMAEEVTPAGAAVGGPSEAEIEDGLDNLSAPPETNLIGALQEIQEKFGYLPRAALEGISRRAHIPLSRIYGVVTFYAQFHTEPRGRHTVLCCRGTACHVRGAAKMVDQVTAQLSINPGETTTDGLFTLECVSCLGACALGPVVVLDGVYYDHMTGSKLTRLVDSVRRSESEGGPGA